MKAKDDRVWTLDDLCADVIHDLKRKDSDDAAFSRLIRQRIELDGYDLQRVASEPLLQRLSILLRDIPSGAECACCGFRPLVNVRRRGAYILGPECVNHEVGACRGRKEGAGREEA
jgi:hypothetical protein